MKPILGKILRLTLFLPTYQRQNFNIEDFVYILVICEARSVQSSMGFKISAQVQQSSVTSNTLWTNVNFFGQITMQRYFVFVSKWSSGPYIIYITREQRLRSGESTCLPPVWPRFESWRHAICGLSLFVVGSLPFSERFFSEYSGFPLSLKTNTFKFQFDLERTDTFQRVLMNSLVLRG